MGRKFRWARFVVSMLLLPAILLTGPYQRAVAETPKEGMTIAHVLKKKWIVDNRPVLLPGKSEDWDGKGVHTPIVFKDGDVYRMYYTGRSLRGDWSIGTATSTDLFRWTKHPEPVLTSGEGWDKQVDFPWTIKVDNTYYMFFEAKENLKTDFEAHVPMTIRHMHSRPVGLATSNDGVHFEKRPRPVFSPDPKGTWDHDGVCAARVYRRGDKYWMFYAGSDGKVARSGLAFSTDLVDWERYEHNPIIDVGAPGDWDSQTALFGSVIELEDGYLAAYEGEDGKKMQNGLAYSKDLKQWTKFAGNPIVRTQKNYINDGVFVCAPHLVVHEGEIYFLYTHNSPSGGRLSRIEVARLE